MATNVKSYEYTYGELDEIAFTSRQDMNLAKWDGEGRLRLYSYTQEDSFRERVGRFIHDGLQQLWEDDQLFDLEVIIDDKVFRCHKVILSAVSGYFRSLLTLDKHGGDTGVVRLEGGHVTPEAFQGLLELLYDGKDVIQNDTAMDMLKAATFLQMRALEYRCVDIMCRRLTEKSCLKIWEWAENYNCPVLASKAKGVALGKFMVLRHTLEFLQMPLERLTTMLGHEMLNFRYEDDLLESILDWVEYDREDRRQYLKELLPYVCFPYLSTKYLNELRKHELIGVKTEFSNFVDEALTYHLAALQKDGKKIQMEVLRRQAHSLKRLMPGMRRVAVLLGGCVVHGEPLTNVIACYLDLGYPQTREVLTFAIASLPRELGFRFASTVWKHDIYVSGGSRAPGSLMVYKPHENNWHELKGLPVGREDHAMVAVDNKLFLLGGRKVSRQGHELVSEIGVYNIEDGTWEKAGDLLIAVESAPAVSVGGKLYLLGGRNGKGRSVRAVQCLDIESGHVTVAGHLPQPVEGARAVVIGRDIILICPDGPVLKMREDASRGRRVTFAHQDSQEAGHRDDDSLSSLDFLSDLSGVPKSGTEEKFSKAGGERGDKVEAVWPMLPKGKVDADRGVSDVSKGKKKAGAESANTSLILGSSMVGKTSAKATAEVEKYDAEVTGDENTDKNQDDVESDDDFDDLGKDKQSMLERADDAKEELEEEDLEKELEREESEEEKEDGDEKEDGLKRQDLDEEDRPEEDRHAEDRRQKDRHAEGGQAQQQKDGESQEDIPDEELLDGDELPTADCVLSIRRIATMEPRRDFGVFVRKSDVIVVGGEADNGNFLDDMMRIHVYTGQTCRADAKLPIPLSGIQVESTAIHQNYLVQFFDASSCFYGQ